MGETSPVEQAALRYLARRDHSIAELQRKLLNRGFPQAGITEAINRLERAGYLDDLRFARQWAESSLRNKRGYGPRLRDDLRRRGVSAAIIDTVLCETESNYDEFEFARDILARKFPDVSPVLLDDRGKRRLAAYLQRRGVSTGVIWKLFSSKGVNGLS
jgi:regulatory protein